MAARKIFYAACGALNSCGLTSKRIDLEVQDMRVLAEDFLACVETVPIDREVDLPDLVVEVYNDLSRQLQREVSNDTSLAVSNKSEYQRVYGTDANPAYRRFDFHQPTGWIRVVMLAVENPHISREEVWELLQREHYRILETTVERVLEAAKATMAYLREKKES